jgi:hypothetical protein
VTQVHPKALPLHCACVEHAEKDSLPPNASHVSTPAPSQAALDGAQTWSSHTPLAQKRPEPQSVSVCTVPVRSHSNAVSPSTQPSWLAVHTTGAHAAVPLPRTQRAVLLQASVVSLVPSALQRSTAPLSLLQLTLSAVHTMSSMDTHRNASQR